ncbi:lasso peptide biosynthesis B2 protein [Streptomyces sp. NPDC059568]|uniref:lasso peptide biosynthesis B2 protein n=1 Tax=Streptomyces sp. NPDC059568 TaxID=3346868 RepID=UPI0036C579CE
MMPQAYTALLPGGAAAVMDVRTGKGSWRHFNSTAARLWNHLADGTPLDQALNELTDHFTRHGADRDTVCADLATLVRRLRDTGLLTARTSPAPQPTAATVRPPIPADGVPSAAERLAGALGLATALLLLRCTPIRTVIALACVLSRVPRPDATAEHADILVHAVRNFARLWPGRAACLEESLAVYLAALLRGCRVTWVLGARTAPAGAHAWTETDGQVIGQDLEDRLWPYAPALRI